jgi:hypothetical protein
VSGRQTRTGRTSRLGEHSANKCTLGGRFFWDTGEVEMTFGREGVGWKLGPGVPAELDKTWAGSFGRTMSD